MDTDHDIWRSALAMIERYGGDAALEAGDCADKFTAEGEIDRSEVWQRIMLAIRWLQTKKRAEGESIH